MAPKIKSLNSRLVLEKNIERGSNGLEAFILGCKNADKIKEYSIFKKINLLVTYIDDEYVALF